MSLSWMSAACLRWAALLHGPAAHAAPRHARAGQQRILQALDDRPLPMCSHTSGQWNSTFCRSWRRSEPRAMLCKPFVTITLDELREVVSEANCMATAVCKSRKKRSCRRSCLQVQEESVMQKRPGRRSGNCTFCRSWRKQTSDARQFAVHVSAQVHKVLHRGAFEPRSAMISSMIFAKEISAPSLPVYSENSTKPITSTPSS
jgi:hypothetical protein